MAPFARLLGEWRMTLASGEDQYQAWTWGPGGNSMRKVAYGRDGDPWAGEVMYWHPGRGQVRVLSAHGNIPGVGRGVGEGEIAFDGASASGTLDLVQPRGARKLGIRWDFDGSDKYHDTLLEDAGAGFATLAEWDFFRVVPRSDVRRSDAGAAAATLPEGLNRFGPLLRHAWVAEEHGAGAWIHGTGGRLESVVEWLPSIEVIQARVLARDRSGDVDHLLDVYVYQEVRTSTVRCLALSNSGGVYEGTLAATLEASGESAGVLRFDLTGYEDDRAIPCTARLEFDVGETLRCRVWTLDSTDRTLVLDVLHHRADSGGGRGVGNVGG